MSPEIATDEGQEKCDAVISNKNQSIRQPGTSRRKTINVEQSLITFMDAHKVKHPSPQEDDAFFYSILPTVKALAPTEKFTFRMETMKLLQNIQQGRTFVPIEQFQGTTQSFRSNSSAASYISSFTPDQGTSDDSLAFLQL